MFFLYVIFSALLFVQESIAVISSSDNDRASLSDRVDVNKIINLSRTAEFKQCVAYVALSSCKKRCAIYYNSAMSRFIVVPVDEQKEDILGVVCEGQRVPRLEQKGYHLKVYRGRHVSDLRQYQNKAEERLYSMNSLSCEGYTFYLKTVEITASSRSNR